MALKASCSAGWGSVLRVHRPASYRPVSTYRSRPARLVHWRIRAGRQGPSTHQSSSSSTANSSNGTPPSIIKESDFSFLGKLVIASFAGAALIKYGSLLMSLPFEPNAVLAIGVVLGVPALYSLYLLIQKQ